MYFLTQAVVACAALPFLVGAVPVSMMSARAGGPILMPLKHHPSHLNERGLVDLRKMQASIRSDSMRFERALKAYERNTGETHPLARRGSRPSNERRDEVVVPLNDTGNTQWTATATFGTPAEGFSVALDSFAASTFVSGVNCTTCQGHKLFDIENSLTVFNENITSTVEVGGGNVTGAVVRDLVTIGGFKVTDQAIFVADEIDPFYQIENFQADGSLGLGFNVTSPFGEVSFFTKLLTTGQLVDGLPVVGLDLDQKNPMLVIAGTAPGFTMNDLTFVNQSTPGFWQFAIDGLSVNGVGVLPGNQQGVLDTASHYIAANTQTIASIYANIPGSAPVPNSNGQYYTIPCETNVTVTMTLAGVPFNIFPNTYNLGAVAGSNNDCMGAFVTTVNENLILGTSFMRNVYTEFHLDSSAVAFAQVSVTE